MTRARAADGKMTIDGTAYAYRSVQRTDRVNPIDVSNSEGIPGNVDGTAGTNYSSTLPDLRSGEFTIGTAFFDDEDNPYAAPISLRAGDYHALEFFPTGLAGPVAQGIFLCVEAGEQGTVGQGALITNSRWRSDGAYTGPGEEA